MALSCDPGNGRHRPASVCHLHPLRAVHTESSGPIPPTLSACRLTCPRTATSSSRTHTFATSPHSPALSSKGTSPRPAQSKTFKALCSSGSAVSNSNSRVPPGRTWYPQGHQCIEQVQGFIDRGDRQRVHRRDKREQRRGPAARKTIESWPPSHTGPVLATEPPAHTERQPLRQFPRCATTGSSNLTCGRSQLWQQQCHVRPPHDRSSIAARPGPCAHASEWTCSASSPTSSPPKPREPWGRRILPALSCAA